MSEWRKVRLGDLGEVNRGRSRHRPRDAAHLYGGPYPFIQTGDIKNSNGRITHHSQTYSAEGLSQSRLWPKGTMVITIAANIAETAILTYPACFPDSVVGFVANREKADVRFIEYLFRLLRRQIQHENVGTGSVQDNINLQTLDRLNLLVPSLAEQSAIASVLGALDDMIDLNRRMNETLETMARAIFKDWFVDFGPTRAKIEGREPYLAREIWSLFPDRLDDDGKPQGWCTEPLLLRARLISGGTPKTEEPAFWGGDIGWASAKDVSQCPDAFLIGTERTITERGLRESATRIIPKLATVVVARGATTGRFCMFGQDMAMNQTCYALSSAHGRPFWLNCAFGSLVESLVHAAHGSVFDTITTKTIEGARVTVASDALFDDFEAAAEPLFRQISANIEEGVILAKTRDLLLPKLMSDEIRLKDVERIAEAAL
jgi:type I restriction enzyme, S subunit